MTNRNRNPVRPLNHSIPDAATMAGVSDRTLYYEIEAGRLKSIKIGRRRLVPEHALLEWLRSLEATA